MITINYVMSSQFSIYFKNINLISKKSFVSIYDMKKKLFFYVFFFKPNLTEI